MSVFQTQSGILQTVKKVLSSTATTTILAGGNKGRTIESINLCEVNGSTPTVILDIYDGTTAYKIRGTLAMTANTPTRYDFPIQLEATDSLRATASAANQVHVVVTYTQPQ